MKKFYNFILLIVLCIDTLTGQEFDLILSNPESGTQTHEALNSITLAPNYSYTLNGGTLTCNILGSWVTGPVSYGSAIDPENRTLNTSYMVGATNGSFNVNPMGGASYTIPIEVLPGINGLAPSLSLVYSGNSGPGIAGYGWQIGGLSVISRGPKTYYHDGTFKGIELDTTDRFYLDGQRLTNTSTFYHSYTAVQYQTDNDIFSRVTPKDMVTYYTGPAWFLAETKSGLKCEYGNTAGSKQKIDGYSHVMNWYISKVSDLFGNQIDFTYLQDNYSVYPTQIIYGPNTITFFYKERGDANAYYIKGTKIEQRYILDKITIKYNSIIAKTYEFKYNFQGSYYNKYSTLNEVIEYGIGTSRLNSTAITYQIPENVSFSQAIYNTNETYITHDSKLFSGDFTGDGKADIFCLPPSGGWRFYKSNGDNTFSLSSTGDFDIDESTITELFAMDINGDNIDDIIFNTYASSSRRYYYMVSDGTEFGNDKFFNASGGQPVSHQYKFSAKDIDNDGLNDYVVIEPSGEINIYSFLYDGGSSLWSMGLRKTLNFGTTVSTSDIIYLSDFNGDGLSDIWKINGSGIKIYTVRGSSLVELYNNTSPATNYFFKTGDFNADGKADLFLYGSSTDWADWQIRLSTGAGFEIINIPQKKANLKNDIIRTGDFNGDGCTDLMVTANSDNGWSGHYYYISRNRGTDFYSHFFNGQTASHNYYIDDYDGDGREDYLCTDGLSPWWTGYMIYRAPGKTNTLMEKVGNGLGFLTKLSYTKLSQATSSVYRRGTGAAFPVSDLQGPLTVVSSVQSDNGRGTMNTQNYYYEGVKIHMQGKGFLGYAKTQVTDVAAGIETEILSGYNSTYFYPQPMVSSRKLIGQSPFETVTNTWSEKVLSPAKKRIFPYVQSTVQSNALTGHSVTITRDYDNYGNPTTITKNYSNGPTETTTHSYSNTVSSTQWLLGRATATTVQSSGGGNTIIRSAGRSFETNNNHLIYETWHSGTSAGIKNEFEYNTNGTLRMQTARDTYTNICRSTQYTYEANGIRILTITDPLSHVTTNAYDTYGRLYTQQDYLTTNIVTFLYDNLHRQASVSKNDGIGASTIYSWQDSASAPLLARYSIQTTGNDGSQTKVWYDKLGREIRSDIKAFGGVMVFNSTEYNIKGQVYRISEPYFSSDVATWNVLTYDNYGRKTGLTTPSGRNSTWQYSGNTVTETTAGKTFSKTYAADGNLTSATDAGGTINYTYYPDGNSKTITAPGGIITSMQYDIAGNQTQLVDPSAGTINYTYNGFGELLTQQNARNQTTSHTYYSDGRLQQKVTPEGTTIYTYNANKQLTGISSPGSVSCTYNYDPKGRIRSITETIPGSSSFSTTFTYDNKGRLSTRTHPSGIVETMGYNSHGYLATISAGGSTRYTITGMNARQQLTGATFGNNLAASYGYDAYGSPASSVTGGVQNYTYSFNPVTGNLTSRQNILQGKSESFTYDNLDRLLTVTGPQNLTITYNSNGNINTKSDIGTNAISSFSYGGPYALTGITSSTGLIPSETQTTTYTSFESVNTISEGVYSAAFIYNANLQRARMTITQNGSTILSRWYSGGSYMKETAGSVTKEFTYIGGDAYSAPVAAVTQDETTVYYNLLRDYLGNITHVVNASNNALIAEYSFDAWGRMRNHATWVNYAPGSEPDLLIAGRGFTGHEHLKWFNIINMNGRLYDPLTGQFLSPDNYVQAPGFTQSYNRYSYGLNNPLKYTDPSGENWFGWLVGGIIGGVANVIANWDDIDGSFVKFNQYAFVGCVAGSTASWLADNGVGGPGIGMASGWLLNSGNAYIRGARGGDVIQAGGEGALLGGVSGFAMMGLGSAFDKLMDIPWTTDYSGVPGNGKEVSLGEAFSRFLGRNISDYIAEQGITNAQVILAASTLSTTMKFEYGFSNSSDIPFLRVSVTGSYSQYDFVQTFISSDYPINPNLDGGMGDMDRGFFRHPDLVTKFGDRTWVFEDTPWHGSGINYNWRAELTIVGRYGTSWYPLRTISWGFNVSGGKVSLTPLKLIKTPGSFHSNWVKKACSLHSGTFL